MVSRWRDLQSRLLYTMSICNAKNNIFETFKSLNKNIANRIPGEVWFTTDTVVDWVNIFARPRYKHIIMHSFRYCPTEKGLIIYAWVLMSNHLHMIVDSAGDGKVSDIMRDLKKFTSKEILRTLQTDAQERRREWMLSRILSGPPRRFRSFLQYIRRGGVANSYNKTHP